MSYRLGKRGAIQASRCCSPGKPEDRIYLGFDLAFVSEMSGMGYLICAEHCPAYWCEIEFPCLDLRVKFFCCLRGDGTLLCPLFLHVSYV